MRPVSRRESSRQKRERTKESWGHRGSFLHPCATPSLKNRVAQHDAIENDYSTGVEASALSGFRRCDALLSEGLRRQVGTLGLWTRTKWPAVFSWAEASKLTPRLLWCSPAQRVTLPPPAPSVAAAERVKTLVV